MANLDPASMAIAALAYSISRIACAWLNARATIRVAEVNAATSIILARRPMASAQRALEADCTSEVPHCAQSPPCAD